MKKARIVFITDAIYEYNKGGKEKRIYEITHGLNKLGYDVHIYCMKWWKSKSTILSKDGIYFHGICKLFPLYSGSRRSIRQALFFAFSCLWLITEDFDVIDVDHMPHLILFTVKIVCVLKRKKLIATWNEVWGRDYWNTYLGRLGNIAYIVEWLSARMPDKVIAVSQHTKSKLRKSLGIKQPIHVVPNGINLAEIKLAKQSQRKSNLMYAGRFLSHKHIDVLIGAVHRVKSKYPNIQCLLIGDGPEKESLKKLVKTLHLEKNVHFLAFFADQRKLYSLMKSSKVFILPSSREGFGIVVLEANACGIPVITTNHSENAAKDLIVPSKNGKVCTLTAEKLAATIEKLITCPISQRSCIDRVEKYEWQTIVHLLIKVYNI